MTKSNTIKALIDKLLIEDLSSDEQLFLNEQIQSDEKLRSYYEKTLQLKEQMESLSDEQVYSLNDLELSRQELFSNINAKRKEYTLKHILVAASLSFVTSAALFISFREAPQKQGDFENVLSYQFSQNDNGELVVNGRRATPYKLVADKNKQEVQQILQTALSSDPNIGNRIVALDHLEKLSSENIGDFRSLITNLLKKETNVPLRLNALSAISSQPIDSELEKVYLDILKKEQNKVIQMRVIEHLANKASEEQRKLLIDQLILEQ